MVRTLVAWFLLAAPVLAAPVIRVCIQVDGEGAGLIVQAYRASLRSTPGVVVVSAAHLPYMLLELVCCSVQHQGGIHTGYAWAYSIVDPGNKAEMMGPGVVVSGPTTGDIVEAVSNNVLFLEKNFFVPTLETAPTPSP
jgi:hypothetical protein